MKIILVIPTLKQGGAERIMSELANVWSSQEHEVHIVLLAKSEDFYKLHTNVIVHKLAFNYTNRLNKTYGELQVFFNLRKIIQNEKPDFVLSFMTKYNALTILASAFLSTKVFVSDRSNPKKKLPLLIAMLRKLTYLHADGIIAQTSLAKDVLIKETGNKNIAIIPNPLKEVRTFSEMKREKVILNTGRLVIEKGQKYLLEAFAKVEDTEWKLVILGDGPLRHKLEEQTDLLGLKDRVLMPGTVNDVDKWLAKASIFAFPSISEGFPNALVEAMSAGLPCVSFDCDAGPRDFIKDTDNGYLVPVGDVVTFLERIENLMNNDNLRKKIGQEATKIREEFESTMIANKYLYFCTKAKL